MTIDEDSIIAPASITDTHATLITLPQKLISPPVAVGTRIVRVATHIDPSPVSVTTIPLIT